VTELDLDVHRTKAYQGALELDLALDELDLTKAYQGALELDLALDELDLEMCIETGSSLPAELCSVQSSLFLCTLLLFLRARSTCA
jgi:hypothetical protein